MTFLKCFNRFLYFTFSFIDEEEMDKLNPNFLLYKAALAHNIPVMCQALALNADKNWENALDFDRTPLHQAILSVSPFK